MHPTATLPAKFACISKAEFVRELGDIYEHSPWVAEAAWPAGPFSTMEQLHDAMQQSVRRAPVEQQLALIQAHPLLGTDKLSTLTPSSQTEQSSAKLDQLSAQERAEFERLNTAYQQRFKFPFIIAVSGRSRGEILDAMRERLGNSREQEFEKCLQEIGQIAKLRLQKLAGA